MADVPLRRPYAAAANVVAVLARARSRNLPDAINNDFLRIAGIPPAVFGRVMEALRFLALVDANEAPSELLRAIASAPEEQYRDLLRGALRQSYRDDFNAIDPGEDSQTQIIDAFRRYEPRSQTQRMGHVVSGTLPRGGNSCSRCTARPADARTHAAHGSPRSGSRSRAAAARRPSRKRWPCSAP